MWSKSPLAQVGQKQCDLVTGERLGGPSPRNLVTVLAMCGFFFFFQLCCTTLANCRTAQCHCGREPGVCETNLNPTMTIFYFIVFRFDKRSSSSQIQEERSENVEVVRLQIIPGLSYHHTNSIAGRTLSCHHLNSIMGRTFDGGFVLPPHEFNHWESF